MPLGVPLMYQCVCHLVCHWMRHIIACIIGCAIGCITACHVVRHGVLVLQVLQHASPAHLTSLTVALDQLDSRYEYDVDYLNSFIRWRVRVPQHAFALAACIIFTTFRC